MKPELKIKKQIECQFDDGRIVFFNINDIVVITEYFNQGEHKYTGRISCINDDSFALDMSDKYYSKDIIVKFNYYLNNIIKIGFYKDGKVWSENNA